MNYPKIPLFIDGKWLSGDGRANEPVYDPSNGSIIGNVPHASDDDLALAITAAERGFDTWRKMPAYERAKIMKNAAGFLRRSRDEIADTLTTEQGKPLAEARAETDVAIDMLEWFAEEGRRVYGRTIPGRAPAHRQTVYLEPVGPAALFTPWNFPAVTPLRKVAAALAAGCSCILKPSEETPATAIKIAEAFSEAGLPDGVFSVVLGDPAHISTRLIASSAIRKASLTGSTRVGRELARLAAAGPKPITLELGGHAPVIVWDDVDVEAVARLSVTGRYRNAGQICLSPTRFLISDKIYDRFVSAFVDAVSAIKTGDGRLPGTTMGPLANARRLTVMDELVADAQEQGAELLAGGNRIGERGYYFEPTVLANVPLQSRVLNEEPFGPIAVLNRVHSLDEALTEANRLPYGLAAYAFSDSSRVVDRVVSGLEAGAIGVNHFGSASPETPFGGVRDSGYGSEGGIEGLQAYTITKFVSHMTGG